MNILSYWIIAALFIFKGVLATIEISPKPAYGKENGSLTFNCTSTVPLEIAAIYSNDGRYGFIIDFTNGPCTATDTSIEKREFTYNCSGNRTLFIKIIKLTRKDHDVQWTCVDITSGFQSVSKTYINVSVENVTLSTNLKEYDDNGVGKVTENSSIEINCRTSPAYPNATVSLIGYDKYHESYQKYSSSIILHEENSNRYFSKLVTYNVTVNRATKSWVFFCSATNKPQVEVKSRNLSVQVLYPPKGAPVILKASSMYLIIEENIGHLTCAISDSNPPTHLNWACYPALQTNAANTASNQANMTWTARRYTNTTCMCMSRYKTASSGNVSLRIITLYPLVVKDLKNLTTIEGNMLTVSCEITSGNVDTISVKWTSQSKNGTTLSFWAVNRSESGWFSCEVSYNMTSSFGYFEKASIEKRLYLDVLYPPEGISVNSTLEPNHPLHDKIRIINNAVVKLFCFASGKPIPGEYKWSGLNSSKSNAIVLKGNKDNGGNITCHSYNNLTEMPANKTVRGTGNRTFIVDVLYPPQVVDFRVVNATEGTDFSLNCISDFGRITSLEVCWHKGNKTVSCNGPLLVVNVTNEDAGLYHCTVHFSMIPTFGEEVSMSIETEIMLQVNAKGVDQAVVSEAPSMAAAVGGTLAGIVVVALVAVVLVYFIRKRKQPPKSTEEKILYQNASSVQSSETASKLVTANIYDDLKTSISKVSDHEYQELTSFPGHRAEGSETASKLVTANIYDDLKPSISKVSDHVYQELTSFPGSRAEGQKKVYENLQLLNRSEKDTDKRGATSIEQGSD